MGFFNKNNGQVLTPRGQLEAKVSSARSNLLLVVVFTVVNIVLAVTNSDTYFLFSAAIPYYIVNFGMALCGKYPAEFYEEDYSAPVLDNGVFIGFVAVAIILTMLYLLAWALSKNNKKGWLIFGLVMFSIDTLLMFLLFGVMVENIIDIAFHVWVIVSLSMGISASAKLTKLPEEDEALEGVEPETEEKTQAVDSAFKRTAEIGVKNRVLAEAQVEIYTIVYRRVGKVNELVVNGYVYDEYVAFTEFAHELKAVVGGHEIVAGFDGGINSYIKFDGKQVAKKIRLY